MLRTCQSNRMPVSCMMSASLADGGMPWMRAMLRRPLAIAAVMAGPTPARPVDSTAQRRSRSASTGRRSQTLSDTR